MTEWETPSSASGPTLNGQFAKRLDSLKTLSQMQADLGDAADSVADHRSKASIPVKQVARLFQFPSVEITDHNKYDSGKCEMLRKLPKCGPETLNEQML